MCGKEKEVSLRGKKEKKDVERREGGKEKENRLSEKVIHER